MEKDHFNKWRQKEKHLDASTNEWIRKDFKKDWIIQGVTKEFVDYAEKAGRAIKEGGLTASQIRNIYGEVKRIQNGDFDKLKSSFFLLKPKVAYAVGRNNNLGLQIFQTIFNECFSLIQDKKTFHNFCNIFEAILAYHKAYGGK